MMITPNDLIIVRDELLSHRGAYVRNWIRLKGKEYNTKSNKMRILTPHPTLCPPPTGGWVGICILFDFVLYFLGKLIQALTYALLWIRGSSPTIISSSGVYLHVCIYIYIWGLKQIITRSCLNIPASGIASGKPPFSFRLPSGTRPLLKTHDLGYDLG